MVIVVTEKQTSKTIILFNENPLFRSLNLVISLLFEEMPVLTSYLRQLH